MSLAQRIQWVIDEGRVESGRWWSETAGYSHSLLSEFLRRAKKDPKATIGVDQVIELARVARVSFLWLATGTGSPDDVGTTVPDGFSTLPATGNATGYVEAEPEARKIARLPLAIFEQVRASRGLVPPNPITPEWIADKAFDAWRNLDFEARAAAEAHETERLAQLIRNRWGGKVRAKDPFAEPDKKPAGKSKGKP